MPERRWNVAEKDAPHRHVRGFCLAYLVAHATFSQLVAVIFLRAAFWKSYQNVRPFSRRTPRHDVGRFGARAINILR